jgi:rRNA maturation RNase YbeY
VPTKSFIFVLKIKIIDFINIPDSLNQRVLENTIIDLVGSIGYSIEKLSYNFVSKQDLLKLNKKFLKHNTNTDVITFDYSSNKALKAEIFISMWAVEISAVELEQSIENETLRVISHGVLHCMGFKDKTANQIKTIREKEDEFIEMFHVKQKGNV